MKLARPAAATSWGSRARPPEDTRSTLGSSAPNQYGLGGHALPRRRHRWRRGLDNTGERRLRLKPAPRFQGTAPKLIVLAGARGRGLGIERGEGFIPVLNFVSVDGGGSRLPILSQRARFAMSRRSPVSMEASTVAASPWRSFLWTRESECADRTVISATFTGPTAPDAGQELCTTNGSGAWKTTYQVGGYNPLWTGVTLSMVGTAAGASGGPLSPDYGTATTLYVVASGGFDTNSCLSPSAACATIQGAVNKLPKVLRHPYTISVGAGTFAAGAYVSGFTIDMGQYAPSTSVGPFLAIQGTMSTAALSGAMTGTVASATAAGQGVLKASAPEGVAWATATVSGAGWTVNQLAGSQFCITGGTASGECSIIATNTATVVTVAGGWSIATPDATSNFPAIKTWGTTINGVLARPAGALDRAGRGGEQLLRDLRCRVLLGRQCCLGLASGVAQGFGNSGVGLGQQRLCRCADLIEWLQTFTSTTAPRWSVRRGRSSSRSIRTGWIPTAAWVCGSPAERAPTYLPTTSRVTGSEIPS